MDTTLVQIAKSYNPTPGSIMGRGLDALAQADQDILPFSQLLAQRQAELDEAARIVASASWGAEPSAIEQAQSRRAALAVIIPKVVTQLDMVSAIAQRQEQALDGLVSRIRAIGKVIKELENSDLILPLSANQRAARLAQLREEVLLTLGHALGDGPDVLVGLEAAQLADLQAQVSGIERRRVASAA